MAPSSVLAALVAVEHAAFLILEMFFWTAPLGLKIFRQTPEAAAASAMLAKNQGLYNGFLAAGLLWGLMAAPEGAPSIKTFFLVCVVAAGAFGAVTVSPRIFFVQALPAIVALALLYSGR